MASNITSLPAAAPVSTQPSSPDQPTVIVIFVISFGCLFVLGSFLLCIWCIFKRHCKKKELKLLRERKDVDVDEHLKVQELVLPGPHGPKMMVVSVEDEVRVHTDVHKDEIEMVGKGLHANKPRDVGDGPDGVGSSSSQQQLSHAERQV